MSDEKLQGALVIATIFVTIFQNLGHYDLISTRCTWDIKEYLCPVALKCATLLTFTESTNPIHTSQSLDNQENRNLPLNLQ